MLWWRGRCRGPRFWPCIAARNGCAALWRRAGRWPARCHLWRCPSGLSHRGRLSACGWPPRLLREVPGRPEAEAVGCVPRLCRRQAGGQHRLRVLAGAALDARHPRAPRLLLLPALLRPLPPLRALTAEAIDLVADAVEAPVPPSLGEAPAERPLALELFLKPRADVCGGVPRRRQACRPAAGLAAGLAIRPDCPGGLRVRVLVLSVVALEEAGDTLHRGGGIPPKALHHRGCRAAPGCCGGLSRRGRT
mmetsp:Transcript_109889/g.354798  ORF Transcript_109889/g.354798 Transcript_109889/m.354798 type:complete len:249 (-) Transcript_109889:7-753(-)